MTDRLSRVRARLREYEVDAALISSLPNVRWACGFTGSNGLLLVGHDGAVFVTDGRYTDQAREEVRGADVVISKTGLVSRLDDIDVFEELGRVAFQADHVTVEKHEKLREHLPDVEWVPRSGMLTPHVARKDRSEIDRIRKAQEITEAVFDYVVGFIEPGMEEREVAAEITYQHLKRGGDEMSFEPIVASGPNGARPHAHPTDRTLREGELVVIDMGCIRDGYASDMTRTVSLGEPPKVARTGYDLVREAQRQALDQARAGMRGKELDAVARRVIEDAGYGEYFSHGLGHGIGLEVHEWPRVSYTVDAELPEGVCVTIEPGLYVPEERFGVRIEDIVVLRSDGCENLTKAPKELRVR